MLIGLMMYYAYSTTNNLISGGFSTSNNAIGAVRENPELIAMAAKGFGM